MIDFPEDIYELILNELNGSIDEKGVGKLRQWLETSPENRNAWQEFCSLWYAGITGERKKNTNQELAWQKIQAGRTRQTRLRIRHFSSIAACLLLFAGLFFILRQSPEEKKEDISISELMANRHPERTRLILPSGHSLELGKQMNQEVEGVIIHTDSIGLNYGYEPILAESDLIWHELIVPRGGEYQITLTDGSVVMLNSGSSLRFPVRFSKEQREVELSGEAYFKVAPRENQAFIVRTGTTTTRVLGTSFNVMAYENERNTEITLVEGIVEVEAGGKTERLTPGFQIASNNSSLLTSKRKVDTEHIISWTSGILRFDDIPLEQLVIRLERWYDISFEFKQEELKQKLFTGGFRKYEDLGKVLDMIEKVNDVSFKVKDTIVTINNK